MGVGIAIRAAIPVHRTRGIRHAAERLAQRLAGKKPALSRAKLEMRPGSFDPCHASGAGGADPGPDREARTRSDGSDPAALAAHRADDLLRDGPGQQSRHLGGRRTLHWRELARRSGRGKRRSVGEARPAFPGRSGRAAGGGRRELQPVFRELSPRAARHTQHCGDLAPPARFAGVLAAGARSSNGRRPMARCNDRSGHRPCAQSRRERWRSAPAIDGR